MDVKRFVLLFLHAMYETAMRVVVHSQGKLTMKRSIFWRVVYKVALLVLARSQGKLTMTYMLARNNQKTVEKLQRMQDVYTSMHGVTNVRPY